MKGSRGKEHIDGGAVTRHVIRVTGGHTEEHGFSLKKHLKALT